MGFGHRVYKNYDPRAKIVKQSADDVLKKLGVARPLLDIAKALEERALADDYFVERKLYPNVDFYTGVIYRAMGFPTKMFTVLFALGRLPGWIAQWREMIRTRTIGSVARASSTPALPSEPTYRYNSAEPQGTRQRMKGHQASVRCREESVNRELPPGGQQPSARPGQPGEHRGMAPRRGQ